MKSDVAAGKNALSRYFNYACTVQEHGILYFVCAIVRVFLYIVLYGLHVNTST